LQRGEENAAQAVAQRHAKAALEGLGHQTRLAGCVGAGLDLRLLGTDSSFQFLSITGCPSKRRIAGRKRGPAQGIRYLVLRRAGAWAAAAVVREWGHVADGGDRHADRPAGRAAPTHGPNRDRDVDFQVFTPCSAAFGRRPRPPSGRRRGRLARTLEAHRAGADQEMVSLASVMVIMVLLNERVHVAPRPR
jgi:hypothetical protein